MSDAEVKNEQPEQPAQVEAPVESKEPAAPDAEAAVLRPAAAVYTFFAFCMLVLFVVATPIDWFEKHIYLATDEYTMFAHTVTTPTSQTVTYAANYVCDEFRQRFRAVEAFAVISILLAGAATIAGLAALSKKIGMIVPLVLGVVVMLTSLIAWAMALRIHYQGLCGVDSLIQQKFEIGPGLALFVTGWCVSFVAILVAARDPVLPAALPDAFLDSVSGSIYTVFAFIGFVFVVIGTPVNIVHLWISQSMLITATMWKITVTSGGVATDYKMNELGAILGDSCPEFDRYAKFAEAFAIIAIAFALFATLSGILFVLRKIGKTIPMLVGACAALFALLSAAACAVMLFRRFCINNLSLDGLGFRIDAGVALFVAAVILLAVGTIILAIIAVVEHVVSKPKDGNVKPTAFLFLAGTVLSLFFLILGASQPLFSLTNGDFNYIKVTFWKTSTLTANVFATSDFGCTDISTRLIGGGALDIIAIFFTLIALNLGMVQLMNANLRKAASFVLLVGSFIQLVSWGLAVTVYVGSYCDNQYYTAGFNISVGLGLIIASWCVSVTVSILNLIVGTD